MLMILSTCIRIMKQCKSNDVSTLNVLVSDKVRVNNLLAWMTEYNIRDQYMKYGIKNSLTLQHNIQW